MRLAQWLRVEECGGAERRLSLRTAISDGSEQLCRKYLQLAPTSVMTSLCRAPPSLCQSAPPATAALSDSEPQPLAQFVSTASDNRQRWSSPRHFSVVGLSRLGGLWRLSCGLIQTAATPFASACLASRSAPARQPSLALDRSAPFALVCAAAAPSCLTAFGSICVSAAAGG